MYRNFDLVLVVNHSCNLRCSYCYTGAKFNRRMNGAIGRRAIERATASLEAGGKLQLGFFGGEPLIEAELISELMEFARTCCDQQGMQLAVGMTTNGTLTNDAAWEVMLRPAMDLVISHDGLPEVHDRHRKGLDGRGSSNAVLATIDRLLSANKDFSVQMVVRPDSADRLAEGISFLHSHGVRYVIPSLDLWCRWSEEEIDHLHAAAFRSANVWQDGIPDKGVSCFDEQLVELTHVAVNDSARCGFGIGEIAVAPSGNLYPCERVVGEDVDGNTHRLPGHVMIGSDFQPMGCSACRVGCACSNFVRTGDIAKPDRLIQTWRDACRNEAKRVIEELSISVVNN